MNELLSISNPCRDLPPEQLTGFVVKLKPEDKDLLKVVMPNQRIVQETLQILFCQFVSQLRQKEVYYASPENTQTIIELLQQNESTSV